MKREKCVLCSELLDDEWGNNAEPIMSGQCCNFCNSTKVIPARIKNLIKT